MQGTKVMGEFYFSQLLGKTIVDQDGKLVGRLRDMAIRWDTLYPRVTGLKFAKGVQKHIGMEQVEIDQQQIRLNTNFQENQLRPLKEDEIYIGKWLLDKQIIDLKGSKLVRVNDIKLAWIENGQAHNMVLMAVDIGLRGMMRRLGLEILVHNRPEALVGWQYINPLETKTASLRLNLEQTQLKEMHPADLADIIDDLDSKSRDRLLAGLDIESTADALGETEIDTQVEIISGMDILRASKILAKMPLDEAADILGELPEEKASELLKLMPHDDAEDVRELMEYPENTAGSIMTTEYIAFPADMTAEVTINKLRELAPEAETIYYLYVVDSLTSLKGVLSLRDLIVAQPEVTLGSIMHNRVVSVNQDDDYRTVQETVTKYDLLAVPVVDEENVLLGIITVDDVIDTAIPDRSSLRNFTDFMVRRKAGRGR
jgi:magnesium transporter